MNLFYKCLTVVLIILTVLLLHTYANADDGVIGRTPDGVYPMLDAEVEMESENIIVDIEKNTAECTFVFHNTGGARDLLMGFPGKLREDFDNELSDGTSLSINHFKTFVKGKELSVKKEKGVQPIISMPDYSEWFTFTVPFEKGERITVRNTYSFQPSYVSTGDVFTGYVLQTGATWKDSIGKARVEFKLGSIQPWQIEQLGPGVFRFEGDSIVWERQDFEPLYDLKLFYNTWYYSSEFLESSDFNGVEKDRILSKIKKYKEIKNLADNNENENLISEYRKAAEAQDTVLANYVASFLAEAQIPDDEPALGEISLVQDGIAYRIDCDIKSLYISSKLLQVSHTEDGKTVLDLERDSFNYSITLTPEVEYNISIEVTDWLDRIAKKTIKYKIPADVSEGMDTNAAGSIDAASENSNDSVIEDVTDTEVYSPNAEQSSDDTEQSSDEQHRQKSDTWVAVLAIALGCMAAAGIILYKKHKI